jgi:hypothetical protein
MFHSSGEERRQLKRFFIKGLLRLQPAGGVFSQELCEVINVSGGGVLILTKTAPVAGSNVEVRFTIQGYNGEIQAKARVVRSDPNLAAIEFTDEPEGLEDLVNWLEAGVIGSFL